MKKARYLVLAAVVVMALFAAVIPALALDDYEIYNWSFEGDKNGDNIPDKWNVKGDVVRLCDHAWDAYTYDNCMMVFLPSNHGAALWQNIVRGGQDQPVWTVVSEEGAYVNFIDLAGATKALDYNRGYIGAQVMVSDGSVFTTYSMIPEGHNPWAEVNVYGVVGGWADDYTADDIVAVRFGVLMLPGDGYAAFDWIVPEY